jgi:hypothetical protein
MWQNGFTHHPARHHATGDLTRTGSTSVFPFFAAWPTACPPPHCGRKSVGNARAAVFAQLI